MPANVPKRALMRFPPFCFPPGELREYVAEEVNVRALTPCADPLKYCRRGFCWDKK